MKTNMMRDEEGTEHLNVHPAVMKEVSIQDSDNQTPSQKQRRATDDISRRKDCNSAKPTTTHPLPQRHKVDSQLSIIVALVVTRLQIRGWSLSVAKISDVALEYISLY